MSTDTVISEPGDSQHDHQHKVGSITPVQPQHSAALPVLMFPRSSKGLKRQKRDWVIPPINFPENDRGPFPKQMVQIRSSRDKEVPVHYKITGPGADQPPVQLFKIDRDSGWLSVTQPLDRETQDEYKLFVHAEAVGATTAAEDPMEIIIFVIDQNDNRPKFTEETFFGELAEGSKAGRLISGQMSNFPKYTLVISAADIEGNGLSTTCKAIITVTDSNDNAPQFDPNSYTVTVPENEVGALVVKMPVTDGDEPHTLAWSTKYKIIEGDNGGFFNVTTGPSKLEGIITTVKGLDFEKNAKYTLLVTVENDSPFVTNLPTSTATVIVNVKDVNEAPVFNPVEEVVIKPENLETGADIIAYTATDPDTARNQKVWYKSGNDPAGWLNVSEETGLIKVRSPMDRESPFVKGGRYRALILAIDDDEVPATGTGTLLIELEDVNDNAPTIEERVITICNRESQPVTLSVTDRDGPGFTSPFRVDLQGVSAKNWTARMNGTKTGIILGLKIFLDQADYNVVLRVYDNNGLFQENTVLAKVCDCKANDYSCAINAVAGVVLPGILGILGAVLLLL
ncbi:B-cadherin-like [Conger conger]|uniref:B-cadherin-like n=1 Tax=Conger conger TaxID=82655 RepID=UPI002A5A19AD|nr:B-cadherin-like [Conger conger]